MSEEHLGLPARTPPEGIPRAESSLTGVVVGLVHELRGALSERVESHEKRRLDDTRDHELRLRELERWQARITGGLALAAILGGAIGAAIVKLLGR